MSCVITRIGVIGCGDISREYLENLRHFPFVSVVGCCDLSRERAAAIARSFGVEAAPSVESLLADRSIGLILNLTPASEHSRVTLAALRAGKHVYSEKPIALNLSDSAAILEEAKRRKLRLGCAPDIILGTPLRTVEAAIGDGLIGRVIAADAVFHSPGPEGWHEDAASFYAAGNGPLMDMGPYYLSALVWLLGPAAYATGLVQVGDETRVLRKGRSRGDKFDVRCATHVCGLVRFREGPIASVSMSFDAHAPSDHLDIHGTRGSIRLQKLGRFDRRVVCYLAGDHDWRPLPVAEPEGVEVRSLGVAELVRAEMAGRPHLCSAELAVHVLEILAAIQSGAACHIASTYRRDRS